MISLVGLVFLVVCFILSFVNSSVGQLCFVRYGTHAKSKNLHLYSFWCRAWSPRYRNPSQQSVVDNYGSNLRKDTGGEGTEP